LFVCGGAPITGSGVQIIGGGAGLRPKLTHVDTPTSHHWNTSLSQPTNQCFYFKNEPVTQRQIEQTIKMLKYRKKPKIKFKKIKIKKIKKIGFFWGGDSPNGRKSPQWLRRFTVGLSYCLKTMFTQWIKNSSSFNKYNRCLELVHFDNLYRETVSRSLLRINIRVEVLYLVSPSMYLDQNFGLRL